MDWKSGVTLEIYSERRGGDKRERTAMNLPATKPLFGRHVTGVYALQLAVIFRPNS